MENYIDTTSLPANLRVKVENKLKEIILFFDIKELNIDSVTPSVKLEGNELVFDTLDKVIKNIINNINDETPLWVIEGISGYLLGTEDKQVTVEIPTIDDLEDVADSRFYSYIYIKFIIDTYGKEFLFEYVKTLNEVEVFGTTFPTISNLLSFELEKR